MIWVLIVFLPFLLDVRRSIFSILISQMQRFSPLRGRQHFLLPYNSGLYFCFKGKTRQALNWTSYLSCVKVPSPWSILHVALPVSCFDSSFSQDLLLRSMWKILQMDKNLCFSAPRSSTLSHWPTHYLAIYFNVSWIISYLSAYLICSR